MAKVKWTAEERSRLAAAVRPLLGGQLEPWELVRDAQESVLPKERHRQITGPSTIPRTLEIALARVPHEPTMPAIERLNRELELEEEIRLLGESLKKEKALAAAALEDLRVENEGLKRATKSQVSATDLEIVKRFFSEIVREALQPPRAEEPSPIAKTLHVPTALKKRSRPDKPRVIIIGGRPREHEKLHLEFGEALELRYFDEGIDGGKIPHMVEVVKAGGTALLWLDNASDKILAAVRAAKIHAVPVVGRIEAMRERLSELVEENA